MKVKNIAFSGFAAAILSGVGAANAAVQIVSPDYVTKAIANKQDTLTAGTGIDITGNVVSADMENATINIDGVDVSVSTALAGAASDAADAKSDAADAKSDAADAKSDAAEAVAAAEGAATAAQTATETANAAKTTAEGAAVTAQTATETANTAKTTADEAKTAAGNAVAAVASKANASDVESALNLKADKSTTYTKDEVDAALQLKANQSIIGDLGTAETVKAYVDAKTENVVNNATLEQVQDDIDALEGLVGTESVATQIANAVIAKDQLAEGVQTSLGLADTALQTNDITSGSENGTIAVDGTNVAVAGLGSAAFTSSEAYAAKGYEGRVQTLETTVADLENYDDTEVRGSISTNAQNIATNAQNISANTQDIATIKTAGYIPAPDGNGMWLANVQGENVSWEAVEILSQP